MERKEKRTPDQSESTSEPTEYIPCEMFLEQTGFFSPSSRRIRNIFSKQKRMRRRIPQDGQSVETLMTIDAIQRFGLPVTFDQDLYRAFLKICEEIVGEHGRLPQPIEVPTKKLLRYAGKAASKRDRSQAREWFEVMRGTQLKGEIYNHRKGTYESLISGVFAQAVLRGEMMPDGEPATRNLVWLSPWFQDNYEHGFVRRFDLTFYNSLRKPIAKSLYSMLEVGFYAASGKPFAKSYSNLCDEFLLVRRQYLGNVKQQLEPAHQELQQHGFLHSWSIEVRKGGFIIHYHPGEKWFADQKARLKRSRQHSGKSVQERGDSQGMTILENQTSLQNEMAANRLRHYTEELKRKNIIR